MLHLLKNSLLIGDATACFDYLEECIISGNLDAIIQEGPELIEMARETGLVHLLEAFSQIIPVPIDVHNVNSPSIEPNQLRMLMEPIPLPIIKHYFSEILYPTHDETVDLLRHDQRLSELYKETTDVFLGDQQMAGEIVSNCANLLESTFHRHIQEFCKTKDALAQRIFELNEKLKPLIRFVDSNEQQLLDLEWEEYRIRRMTAAKQDLCKGISYIQHQISHAYSKEKNVSAQYYELLYRDKIIRYQSTQLANSSANKVQSDYKNLLTFLSKVTNIAPVVLDENLVNISEALKNEEYVDFAAARELLQPIDTTKPIFTRKDSIMPYP